MRKNPQAVNKLTQLADEGEILTTTIVNSAELFYGAYKSNNVDKEKEKIQLTLSRFIVFGLDENSAEKLGELIAKLEKQGQKNRRKRHIDSGYSHYQRRKHDSYKKQKRF